MLPLNSDSNNSSSIDILIIIIIVIILIIIDPFLLNTDVFKGFINLLNLRH